MENWDEETPFAITVCDKNGIITHMNKKSKEVFAKGKDILMGADAAKCHPGATKQKFVDLLKNQEVHCYTIYKNGQKKLIYQSPVFQNGEFAGFVELSLPIPEELPHFVRG